MGLVGGKYVVDMINFKVGFMDFVLEEYYKEWLRQWKKDEESVKEKFEEIEGMLLIYVK